MSNVIPFSYQGHQVRFDHSGWLHATKIAERFGKRLDRWLENADTLEYIRALDEALTGCESKILHTRNSGYVRSSRARVDRGGGTWLHPKLAVAFARWCDAKFSVWCDLRIDALLRGGVAPLQEYERASTTLEECKAQASLHGRGLAAWRRQKPPLMREVEYWREQMQMVLGLEEPTSRTSGRLG